MAVNGITGAEYLLTRLGNAYKQEDCVWAVVINLIRNCAGGNKSYRTAGCTELWNSYEKSGEYRHITTRMTLAEAQKNGLMIGDLPVIYDSNTGKCEHIAYYMGGIGGYECIHSSKSKGFVCGTTLKNGFTHVLRHRDITGVPVSGTSAQGSPSISNNENEGNKIMSTLYYAKVATQGGALNLRSSAAKGNNIMCEIPFGTELAVLEAAGEWTKVDYSGKVGYVSSSYLAYSRAADSAADDEQDSDAVSQTNALFGGTWGVFIPFSNKVSANMAVGYFKNGQVIKVKLGD